MKFSLDLPELPEITQGNADDVAEQLRAELEKLPRALQRPFLRYYLPKFLDKIPTKRLANVFGMSENKLRTLIGTYKHHLNRTHSYYSGGKRVKKYTKDERNEEIRRLAHSHDACPHEYPDDLGIRFGRYKRHKGRCDGSPHTLREIEQILQVKKMGASKSTIGRVLEGDQAKEN